MNTNNKSMVFWEHLIKNPSSIRKKLGVQLAARSGSMMLSGLLDGHDEILTFNPYVERGLIHHLYALSVNPSLNPDNFHQFLTDILKTLIEEFKNNPLVPAEIANHYSVDLQEFSKYVKEISKNINALDYDLMVNVFYIAYGITKGHFLSTNSPILLIQLHGPLPKQQLDLLFGSLKNTEIIAIVRNTIKSIDSHFYFHHYEWPLPHHMEGYNRLIYFYQNCFNAFLYDEYRDNSFCMFYEDVHTQPELTMRTLARHLSISFSESLLTETQDAQPMGIMIMKGSQRIINTSSERAKNTRLRILASTDVWFIELFLKDIIEGLGYPLRSSKLQRMISPFFISKMQLRFFKKTIAHILSRKTSIKAQIDQFILSNFDMRSKKITKNLLSFFSSIFNFTVIFTLLTSAAIRLIFDRPFLLLFYKKRTKQGVYQFQYIKPEKPLESRDHLVEAHEVVSGF